MQLTDEQQQIRETARAFAQREIAPHAAEWDRAGATPRELYTRMAEVGLMGMMIDPEWGGAGADFVSYALAIEGELYAIYTHEGPVTIDLPHSGGGYEVRWYDPRKGGPLQIGSDSNMPGAGVRNLGKPPHNKPQDWVILVERKA